MKHGRIRIMLWFCLISIIMFSAARSARAMSVGSLIDSITNPISEFVNNIEKTITNGTPHISSLESIKKIDVTSLEPGGIFTNFKMWFAGKVGGDIGRIVKRVGDFLADILSFLSGLLRKALALLP